MANAKGSTTRTRNTATVGGEAQTKAGSVDATAVVDLNRVRKPLYAYVGVADLAVEKIRALPEVYSNGVNTAQAQVSQARNSVKTLPVSVRDQLGALPDKAKGTYADLAARGQKLVRVVRRNPNTEAVVQHAKTAKSQAKGAATSASRSVNAAEKVAEDTAPKIG